MIKSTIFTIAVLIALSSSAYSADDALAFGTTTTEGRYLSVEIGFHTWASDNVQILTMYGMTPLGERYDDSLGNKMYDLRATVGVDCIVRPWDRAFIAVIFGIHSEHLITRNRTLREWDYRESLVLGEVGVSLYFAKNWAIAGLYRSGVVFNHQGPMDDYTTPKRDVSIRLYCWVI